MDTLIHLGAHRTGSSTLQHLLRAGRDDLASAGLCLWTPPQTRGGRLVGVTGDPARIGQARQRLVLRARGRVRMAQSVLAAGGGDRLLVSEENLLGALRENTGLSVLYPTVARRMAWLRTCFGPVAHIGLAVRDYGAWWTSAFGFLMTRGYPAPDAAQLAQIVAYPRGWRDVICDVACTFPEARLTVWSHEGHAARPEHVVAALTGVRLARPNRSTRLNATPLAHRLQAMFDTGPLPQSGGRFAPFTPAQRADLRARYHRDIAWLRAGADGLAEFLDDMGDEGAQDPTAPRYDREGMCHDRSHQAMGRTG